MIDIGDILRASVVDGELKTTSNDLMNRVNDIIALQPDLDLIEATTLLIEELDISEIEFMKLINSDFKSLLINCAGTNRKVQKKVCYANENTFVLT